MALLPPVSLGAITLGDAAAFLALILVGVTSLFMLLRPKLLKLTKNIAGIRVTHILISALAGVFMILHIAYSFLLPTNVSMDLGYFAVGISIAVWLTGTAFLERLRDSLFFHGTLSSALVGVVMIHAATANVNIPFVLSEIILGVTLFVMLVNATFHLNRAVPRGQSPRGQSPGVPKK